MLKKWLANRKANAVLELEECKVTLDNLRSKEPYWKCHFNHMACMKQQCGHWYNGTIKNWDGVYTVFEPGCNHSGAYIKGEK